VPANVSSGHPSRVQGDDAVVEPVQTGLTLADDLGFEAAGPVSWHGQVDRADLGQEPLRCAAVARVARAAADRVVLVIAQMFGQLLTQRPLQNRLGHLRKQPIRAEQLHALGLRPSQQLIRQLLIDQRRITIRHIRSVAHNVRVNHLVNPFRVPRTQSRATSLTQTS